MNVPGVLSRIVRASVRRIVVVMVAVVVVMVTVMVMLTMVVMIMAIVIMAMVIMAMVIMNEEVREDASRRPIGHTDHRRECKQQHHRPDQGNAASARSFQSRQHPVRCQSQCGLSKAKAAGAYLRFAECRQYHIDSKGASI